MSAMPIAVQVVDPGPPGPRLGRHTGFAAFEQSVLACTEPASRTVAPDEEEVLFVLAGHGELELDGQRHALDPEAGAHLRAGEAYTLHPFEPLHIVSVRIPGAEPGDRTAVVSRLRDQDAQAATTDREFRIVANTRAATHFVGYIPTVRAPDHFHTYDEVIYVLDGVGVMRAQGRDQPLSAGSAIQLPARTVHCLENTGPDVMRIVAVFRPSGSPAAAYYPDGTPAYPGMSPTHPAPDSDGAGSSPLPRRRSSQ
jgi:quercetin dioxygenase-like cupin family protein